MGSRTSARPIATRWRWPPESARGLRASRSSIPSVRAISSTRARTSARGSLRSRRPKAMLSKTFICGYSAYSWKTIATSRRCGATSLTTSPSIAISPAVIVSSPAVIRSAVVLPQPEGPTKTMNSPSPTSRLRSRTAPALWSG